MTEPSGESDQTSMDYFCPQTQVWARIYSALLDVFRTSDSITEAPPKALRVEDLDKGMFRIADRWKETVSWAEKYDCMNLVVVREGEKFGISIDYGSMEGQTNFICPQPQVWARIQSALSDAFSSNDAITEEPPRALILGGSHTSDIQKKGRWMETVRWADKHDCMHLIPELKDEEKYCVFGTGLPGL